MKPAEASDAIVKEIVINAPASRIFDALTDPLQRVKWWGVEGKFQATHMESDLRPGGTWRMRVIGPGGHPLSLGGEYRVIDRPRALEFTWRHESPGADPLLTLVRFDLDERDGATTVRLTHSGLATEQSRQHYQGWPWLLALLRSYVERQPAAA